MQRFGPNDFFVMQKCMKEDAAADPQGVVALLKLGDWDADVFYKFRDTVLNQVPTCSHKLRNDLCRGMPLVWRNYYMLDKDKDVAFEVGRFYYGIRDYKNALRYYENSTDNIGEHHVTYHNMGLCYYSIGKLESALEQFNKSLALNADYEKARSWEEKVRHELAAPAAGKADGEAADGGAPSRPRRPRPTGGERGVGGAAATARRGRRHAGPTGRFLRRLRRASPSPPPPARRVWRARARVSATEGRAGPLGPAPRKSVGSGHPGPATPSSTRFHARAPHPPQHSRSHAHGPQRRACACARSYLRTFAIADSPLDAER